MKKIIFSLIIALLFIPIGKANTWFGHWEKIESMIITFSKDDQVYSNHPFVLKMEDGKIVYCIRPFTKVTFDEPYIEYSYNDSKLNISDEQLEKIKLIAYYGYNYPGHEDVKWYGITQFLIWKTFDLDDIYFVDSKGGNRINAYQDEINEIETLVQNHNVLPSFIEETLNYKSNSNYTETDINNVLSNYKIKSSNINSQIIDNKLSINTEEDGEYYVEFERIRNLNNDYILYWVEDNQNLFYPGGIEDFNFRLSLKVNTGIIIIEKKDSEGRVTSDATLEGAVYSVIKDGVEISSAITNIDGIALVSNLDLGEYLVKEVKESIGYTLDNNVYYVNLTEEKKIWNVISYEEIIMGKIVLNKYYGEEDNYELEDCAKFELYNNSELLKTYETVDGVIKDILPYGSYSLKQTKGEEGYKLINNYEFSIEEDREYIIDLYNDPIEKEIVLLDEDKLETKDMVYNDIIKLEVEVPNTGAKSKFKYCAILIIVGVVLIIISFKYDMYNKK